MKAEVQVGQESVALELECGVDIFVRVGIVFRVDEASSTCEGFAPGSFVIKAATDAGWRSWGWWSGISPRTNAHISVCGRRERSMKAAAKQFGMLPAS